MDNNRSRCTANSFLNNAIIFLFLLLFRCKLQPNKLTDDPITGLQELNINIIQNISVNKHYPTKKFNSYIKAQQLKVNNIIIKP